MMRPRALRAGASSTTQQPLLPRPTHSRLGIWCRPVREATQRDGAAPPYGIDHGLRGSLMDANSPPYLLPSRHKVMGQHRQLTDEIGAVAVRTGPLRPNGGSIG